MKCLMRHARWPGAVAVWPSVIASGRTFTTSPHTGATTAAKAALMVVGDEILRGSIVDTNTPWLAKLLYSRGVDLVRVECIPDVKDDIAATALRLKALVGDAGVVFSSGGIGPTPDDLTYEALAAAFGVGLEVHPPTLARMEAHYASRGQVMNAARLRMATLPYPAEVLHTPSTWVPLVNLQGVYILPGIPKLFQTMISAHQDRFKGVTHKEVTLFSVPGESFITDALAAVTRSHPGVALGSYPNTDTASEDQWKTKVVLSSRDDAALAAAVIELRAMLPHLTELPPSAGA